MDETGSSPKRKPQLDFLRGVAILLVLGSHIIFHPPLATLDIALFGWLLFGGWMGVDLFFVLSGYLVSSLIFKEYLKLGKYDPWNFLIRRGFKIYPGYYFFLFSTIPLLFLLRVQFQWINVLWEALFVQNYLPGIWPQTWSLAIEEHFYISFCVVTWLLIQAKLGTKSFKYACIFCLIACFGLRVLAAAHPPWSTGQSHLRMDSLAFGVLLSYMHHFERDKLDALCRRPVVMLLLGIQLAVLGLVLLPKTSALGFTLGLSLIYMGFGCVLLHALYTPPGKGHFYNLVCRIGYYSYSIYLWHKAVNYFLQWALSSFFPRYPQDLHVVLYLVGAVVWGSLMAKLVEIPCLRLRDKLFPSKTGLAA